MNLFKLLSSIVVGTQSTPSTVDRIHALASKASQHLDAAKTTVSVIDAVAGTHLATQNRSIAAAVSVIDNAQKQIAAVNATVGTYAPLVQLINSVASTTK